MLALTLCVLTLQEARPDTSGMVFVGRRTFELRLTREAKGAESGGERYFKVPNTSNQRNVRISVHLIPLKRGSSVPEGFLKEAERTYIGGGKP